MNFKDVLAVIISYNGLAKIRQTVDALRGQVGYIHIVDNGSGAESLGVLDSLEREPGVTVERLGENRGVGHALNRGVQRARQMGCAWLLTMDQDSIAGPRMVETLLACRESHYAGDQAAVSLSPAIIDSRYLGVAKNRKLRQRHEARLVVITSGHLVKLSAYDKIDTYDERMFVDSVDFEFCLRLKAAGLKTIRCYDAKLYHSLGAKKSFKLLGWQITLTTHSPIRRYYIIRNHVYITSKYLFRFPMWCIRKHLGTLVLIFQILLFETDKLENSRQILRGFIDGVRATIRGRW
jgi:rhamnosyltransferase